MAGRDPDPPSRTGRSVAHTSQRSRSGGCPAAPHRQQTGGNSAEATVRASRRMPGPIVDMKPPFSLTSAVPAGNIRGPSSVARITRRLNVYPLRKQRDMRMDHTLAGTVRHDWTVAEVESLFAMPFMDLLFHAQQI